MVKLPPISAGKVLFKGLGIPQICKWLITLLNLHWSDTDEGTARFDPIPNPKRFLIASPPWLPKSLHRHVDCGEPGTGV